MNREFLELTELVMQFRRRDCFRTSLSLGGWNSGEQFTFSLSVSTDRKLCFFDAPHDIVDGFKTRVVPLTGENVKAAKAWLENLYHEIMESAA